MSFSSWKKYRASIVSNDQAARWVAQMLCATKCNRFAFLHFAFVKEDALAELVISSLAIIVFFSTNRGEETESYYSFQKNETYFARSDGLKKKEEKKQK